MRKIQHNCSYRKRSLDDGNIMLQSWVDAWTPQHAANFNGQFWHTLMANSIPSGSARKIST